MSSRLDCPCLAEVEVAESKASRPTRLILIKPAATISKADKILFETLIPAKDGEVLQDGVVDVGGCPCQMAPGVGLPTIRTDPKDASSFIEGNRKPTWITRGCRRDRLADSRRRCELLHDVEIIDIHHARTISGNQESIVPAGINGKVGIRVHGHSGLI